MVRVGAVWLLLLLLLLCLFALLVDMQPLSYCLSLSPPAVVVVVCFESILGRFSQGPVKIPVGGHQLVLGCLSLLREWRPDMPLAGRRVLR
jgi:hypothetical protein